MNEFWEGELGCWKQGLTEERLVQGGPGRGFGGLRLSPPCLRLLWPQPGSHLFQEAFPSLLWVFGCLCCPGSQRGLYLHTP